jgi:glyoxylase-like metal-dependent hydrolase (beta-lactamase superfamily II)
MKIHTLQTGTVTIHTCQVVGEGTGFMRTVNMLRDPQWTAPLPILTWVIEHPEGVIVVDTGETAVTTDPKNLPHYHPFYRGAVRFSVRPEQELASQLKSLGIATSDVRKVIMTHLHSDHAGGISQFPKSEILVHPAEFAATQGIGGYISGYLPQFFPAWFSPKSIALKSEPFGAFPASQRVTQAGDVVIVPTYGHTPSHVSVIVVEDNKHIFLGGDTSYTEKNLQAGLVDGVSPNVTQAAATNQKILQHRRQQPTVYLVTHDPESAARLENRTILAA